MSAIANKPTSTAESRVIEYVPFGDQGEPIKLSMGIVRDFVANKTKSGQSPTDTQLMKFMMLCKSRRLNPFEGDAFLVGYDSNDGPTFSLITAHQAFLKRAELSKEYDGMESGVIVLDNEGNLRDREGDFFLDGETLVGAWATVHFKTRKYPMRERIKLGTFNQHRSRWKLDPGGMIVKCAESSALRKAFPTMLGGLYTEDEMPPPSRTEASPRQPLVERIAKLNGKAVESPQDNGHHVEDGELSTSPEKPAETPAAPVMVDEATIKAITQECISLGLDDLAMRRKAGVRKWGELTMDAACDILNQLRTVPGSE